MAAQDNGKVQLRQGGDHLDIQSGGMITAAGTQASAITDALTGTNATASNCATTVNLILTALRGVGVIASA